MIQPIGRVSIIIPVYNEALLIGEILRRVFLAELVDGADREVVVVDDGSTDGTVGAIQQFLSEHPGHAAAVKVHTGLVNHGKGAALRAGFRLATGDIILIQDGDLEYSPTDYPALLAPFADPQVDVVYGSRFYNGLPKDMRKLNLLANLILTYSTRVLYGQRISDEATGYKVFRRAVLGRFELACRGFEFCPEFTGKAMLAGIRIHEVPIHYNPRGILEGKKIRATDGLVAIYWLAKVKSEAVWGDAKATWKRRRTVA